MKKSTVAVGVIVALGVVWSGGAWFTGKTAEAEYQRQIDYINAKLGAATVSAGGIKAKIENVKFDRGVFSSDFSYDLNLTVDEGGDTVKLEIPTEGKLYHGPLPFNRLSQFDFTPAMFSAHAQVARNDKTKFWFEATKGKNPMSANTTMGYNQRIKGELLIAPGELNLQGLPRSSWSEGTVAYDTDHNGEGRYEYHIAQINSLFDREVLQKFGGISEDDDTLNSMEIEISDLKGSYDFQPTELANIFVGEHNGTLGGLKYAYTYKDDKMPPVQLEFNNWAFNYSAAQQDGFLNYSLKNKAESINLNQHALGRLQFDMQFNHLAAKATNDLIEAIAAENSDGFNQAGLELLRNQPHLQISPLSLINSEGTLDTNLNIELADVDFAKALQGKYLSLFKQLNFQIGADKAAMANIMSILHQIEGKSKEEADKAAQQQLTEYVAQAVHDGSIIDSEKNISASLILENGELKFNGNVIPEEYIGMFLMGLMMSQ